MTSLNEKELVVLRALAEVYVPDEWRAYAFKGLASKVNLEIKEVRRACRSLTKKGLAAYERSLWSDDGPAGAGYRATEEGAAFISPCDVCGLRATYDYTLDDRGLSPWDKGFSEENSRHIQECDDHYKHSTPVKLNV